MNPIRDEIKSDSETLYLLSQAQQHTSFPSNGFHGSLNKTNVNIAQRQNFAQQYGGNVDNEESTEVCAKNYGGNLDNKKSEENFAQKYESNTDHEKSTEKFDQRHGESFVQKYGENIDHEKGTDNFDQSYGEIFTQKYGGNVDHERNTENFGQRHGESFVQKDGGNVDLEKNIDQFYQSYGERFFQENVDQKKNTENSDQRNLQICDQGHEGNFEKRDEKPFDQNQSDKTDVVEEDQTAKQKPFRFSQLSRRKALMLLLVAACNFYHGCTYSVISPFFPLVADKKGVPETVTGLVFSSFVLVISVSSAFYGNFLVKIGPKFMFTAGVFVGGVCLILFGFVDKCPPGLPFVVISFLCRITEALGMAALTTAGVSICTSEFPQHVSFVLGFLETALCLGYMAGGAVGGLLYDLGGFGLSFFVLGSLMIVTGVVTLKLLPTVNEVTPSQSHNVFSLLLIPKALIASISTMIVGIGVGFYQPLLAVHLERFQLSSSALGLIFIIAPGCYTLSALFVSYLIDSKGIHAPLLIIGNIVCGLGALMLGPSPYLSFLPFELWVILVGLAMLGLFYPFMYLPAFKCLLSAAIDMGIQENLDTYGKISGLFFSVYSLGAFLGPTLGGILAQHIGFRYGITVIGGLFWAAALWNSAFFATHQMRPKKTKIASN